MQLTGSAGGSLIKNLHIVDDKRVYEITQMVECSAVRKLSYLQLAGRSIWGKMS